jgi:hypothetical protein
MILIPGTDALRMVKMKRLILYIVLLNCVFVEAQQKIPGGVKGVAAWEISEITQPGYAKWSSNLKIGLDSGFTITGRAKTINNYPAILFNAESKSLNSTLNLRKPSSFSVFTVCQGVDTLSERVILSLENDSAADMVLTNRRMAALDVFRYTNYNTHLQLIPQIYTYVQNKPDNHSQVSRRLQLGLPPRNQQLPLSAFNGLIPEVIIYYRVLSPLERQKVESYLALKYAISLNQQFPRSYLNSNGETIWDAEKNEDYNQNIAGIGRDDMTGLSQYVSESIQSPGVMKISVSGKLKDNSFLVWGDNGKPLMFEEEPGLKRLKREWKISAFNFISDSVNLETNELSLNEIKPLDEGEIFWMMNDKSGTGKFPFGQTEYIQSLPFSSASGFIRFGHVFFDTDHSGMDVFTLLAAPRFFSRSIVMSPTCLPAQSGSIQTEIAGGVPPFRLLLKGISNNRFLVSANENSRTHVFGNIEQGPYLLTITDSENESYTEKILVSNEHGWETSLSQSYKLPEGESILLDASKGMPVVNFTYSWATPGGSVFNQKELEIDLPGNYLLSVTDDKNCKSIIAIDVRETGKSNIKGVELFPNPSGGWFVLRISLESPEDINVIISDISGKVLKQTMLRNDYYYLYNDLIQQQGVYFITLVSDNEKETIKLVVQ